MTVDPPRRTMDRGPDPDDPSFALIAVLPQIPLCDGHNRVSSDAPVIGWCDDEQCRVYGEVGEPSRCGAPYKKLKR